LNSSSEQAMPLITQSVLLIQRYWIALTVFNIIVVSILSLTPLENLPHAPGGDKTHHLIAYACLIFPCALKKPNYWIAISFFCVAWGGAIELIQPYVNRYGEWLDLAANTLGIVIGILSANFVNHLIQNKRVSNTPQNNK